MQLQESDTASENEVIKDKSLLDLFWALANNNEDKRIQASQALVTDLCRRQEKSDGEELCVELNYTFSRLVQGLGSGRKSARLGFATALTSLLMNTPSSLFNSTKLLKLMARKLSVPTGLKSEKKEVFLGQVFCFLSLVQSKKLVEDNIYENITTVVKTLLNLSKSKSYLKKISYHGLSELVSQVNTTCFEETLWPSLFHLFGDGWEGCTPELLQLLIMCNKCHPQTCGKYFLQSKHWIPHKSKSANLICKHNYKHIARIIADTTSCHPAVDGFALELMSIIGGQGADNLGGFWEEHLTKLLFNSSPERKYLGLKLAVHSLSHINQQQVPKVWSQELLSNLHYSLQRKDHVLHLVCKKQLPTDLASKLTEDSVTPDVQSALLFQIFNSPGGLHFDSITHSNIVSTIIGHLKPSALTNYTEWLKRLLIKGTDGDTGIGAVDLGVVRRWSGSQLVHLTRAGSLPRNEAWIASIAKFLFFHSRFSAKENSADSDVEEIRLANEHHVDIGEDQSAIAQNVSSIMTVLSNMPPLPADPSAPLVESNKDGVAHIPGVMSSGNFWLSYMVQYVDRLLSSDHVQVNFEFDEFLVEAWNGTMKNIAKVSKAKNAAKSSEGKAMELLLIHVALQLLSLDPEVQRSSLNILNDLETIIKQRFSAKKSKKSKLSTDEPPWVEVIIEILLNMLSIDSHSTRVMAEQVFRLVCPHLTERALNLIIDVLKMKSNHDIIKYERDRMDLDEEDDEDADNEEVEADSDSEEESEDDEDDAQEENVDEEFKIRIQEALGDAAAPLDEDEEEENEDNEEEELSDDAMMRLDGALSDLFRLRKKAKPAKKDVKRHLMHFQIRCLDLIEVFISRDHGNNSLVLDLVLPLLEVIEHATKDSDKDILAERASIVLRVKLCKIKRYPRDLDDDAIERCHSHVEEMLKMCNQGNRGVFFSQIVSSACLFYLRVLSGCHSSDVVDGGRVCGAYGSLLEDFMTRRQSKIQHCIFTDLVHRQPAIAQDLIDPLIGYVKDGVLPYRKMQACHMLHALYLSPESRQKASEHSRSLVGNIHDIMTSSLAAASEMKPKYFVEVVKLLHLPVVSIKKQDDNYDFSALMDTMQKLLVTEEFRRSQGITNNIWKILTTLGMKRTKAEKVRKVKKERKRKKPKTQEDEAENAVTTESRRETKTRVMKEKRMARKVKKAIHPESNMNTTERVKNPKKRKRTENIE